MMQRDLKLFDVIKNNKGFENKSEINREYLTLQDKYKVSNSDGNYIGALIMLGYEYDDKYIIPDYQRELKWTLEQKQNLIKSILYGNPIGDFLFKKEYGIDEKGNQNTLQVNWFVIDGQQRINAIREFVLNQFTIDNKYFKDLNFWDARKFLESQVKVISLMDITLEEEIEIYLNRNCGGTMHTKEELDKARSFLNNSDTNFSDIS